MKKKTIGIGKKVIPATAALGILFSMAPIGDNKASAGIGVLIDSGITILGSIADTYGKLGISPEDQDIGTHIDVYAENRSYRAPNFASGEFNISMYHTTGDLNFSKSIKVLYPNGRIETHQLKSGKQLKITEAGAIIDLNPNATSISEHNFLYITQAQLDEGKTGVVMNQEQTAFVEKTSGKNPRFLFPLYEKYSGDPVSKWTVIARNLDYLFDKISNKLSDEQKRVITLTSKPVSKDVLENYVKSDSKAFADFHNRSTNLLVNTILTLETPIVVGARGLDSDESNQVIPYEKGSNKVVVKIGSKYLSGKEGQSREYSDSIGDDEVLELVQIENLIDGRIKFKLRNKNGARLSITKDGLRFTNSDGDNVWFAEKNNNEIHNWLRGWYPGKEGEKQKYDGIQIVADEYERHKLFAKDSSGNVIKNSWVPNADAYYYAGPDGFLLKGWQEIEGKTYYFKDDSSLLNYGSWDTPIDNKFYNFDDNGALQRSAWASHSDGWYQYSDASGVFVKGLREIEGKIYYFQGLSSSSSKREVHLDDQDITLHFSGDKGALEKASKRNGEALSSITHVTLDEKTLVFEKDGSIRKSGVSKIYLPGLFDDKDQPALVYYSLEEGPAYYGGKEIDGKKYYFKRGIHYTFEDHETIDGRKYYFTKDGEAKLTGFEKVGGKIYHYDDKGVEQKGWQEIDGKWYYFKESGEATIGGFSVYGYFAPKYGYYKYYAKQDGSIYQNETAYLPYTKDGLYIKTNFDSNGHYKLEGQAKTAFEWSIQGIRVSD